MIDPDARPPVTLQYATPARDPMVRNVGLAQRRVMWIILGALLSLLWFGFGSAIMPANGSSVVLTFSLILLFRVGMIVLMMIGVYQLSSALKYGMVTCILYVISMIVPLVSLIVLVSINQKATNVLKRNGIKVGLMGARVADLPQ